MVNNHKTNWHHMLFSALWAYCMAVKTSIGFTPFHLVDGVEDVIPIEFEIPNLHTAIELLDDTQPLEQRLVQLELVDENRCQSLQHNEAHNKSVKASFDRPITPRSFTEGELFLCYDVAKEALGLGKFETLWKGPYIIKHCLR